MILLYIWAFVAGYFLLLLYAVGLELAVAGSVIFVFWAAVTTFKALLLLSKARRERDRPTLPGVANLNQPPR
jgi:hypothetical protein